MEKEIFVVQFSNGIDRRSVPTLQPDAIFAAFGRKLTIASHDLDSKVENLLRAAAA
jgi:hypothetical protein